MAEAAATDWIEHDGGACPVDVDTLVQVRFRDGDVSSADKTAGWWSGDSACLSNWVSANCLQCGGGPGTCDADIIAYRVVQS